MSTPVTPPTTAPERQPPQPSRRHPVLRFFAIAFVFLIVAVGFAAWYTTTAGFHDRVRQEVVSTLENSTGGRVELAAIHWRLLHLEIEADNLTVHGLEAPSEIPYAHIDRLFIRAKIVSLLRARVGLNYLGADRPVVHLIVYPDGTTNQPQPRVQSSNKSTVDTFFDLAIDRAELGNGLAIVNDRPIPFDVSANDVGLTLTYVPSRDHYLASLHVADLSAERGKNPAVHSDLALQVDMGRGSLDLTSLNLKTANDTLQASGNVKDFNNPHWGLRAAGRIDVRTVESLTAVPGLEKGIADLKLEGSGSGRQFSVNGQASVAGVAYRATGIVVSDVDARANLSMTDQELALTQLEARLAPGGTAKGELHIVNWLAPTPAPAARSRTSKQTAPPPPLEKGTIRADISGVKLATIMRIVAPARYQDLGFDTAASGKVAVDWVGDASDLTTKAVVSLAPPTPPTLGQVPLTGLVDAEYFNRGGRVQINQLDAQTPGTQVHVKGQLGVYPVAQESALQAELTTSNLGEFNRTLIALGLTTNGKSGAEAIPVLLHGPAEFQGTVTGTITNPDVKGHLTATNFDTTFFTAPPPGPAVTPAAVTAKSPSISPANPPATAPGLQNLHWDKLDAQAEYSPTSIAVGQATLTRGATVIHASGQLRPHVLGKKSAFDEYSPLNAQVSVRKASLADLAVIAGSTVDVTGTADLQAHATGTVRNLSGGGNLTVTGGAIYGEPYHSLTAQLRFAGREIDATNLTFLQNGGKITGDGGYDLGSNVFHFNAQGSGFELAHLQKLQGSGPALTGNVSFNASGSGTAASPSVQADLRLAGLTVAGQAAGNIEANAHTRNKTLFLTLNSSLDAARLQADGQIQLTGEYAATAHLTISQLDVTPFLKAYHVQGLTGPSTIGAQATIQGPLKQPRKMGGDVTVDKLSVALAGVPLQTVGGLHVQLRDGVVHLDPFHITGDDTDLRAQGSIDAFQPSHTLDLQASGHVNVKLIETVNPDVTSSGHVDFTVAASGSMQKPDLKGQVKFTNVAVALEDLPNGLSKMNGTLVFDQDRLEVQDLTAMTGGGQLKLAGYLTYRHGIYGDLTATGKDVRIRYPEGISSMADARLHLQGAQNNLLLSGNVLLTRFSISPNLDTAALTSSSGSVSAPPDPNSPSNHVRLDVHITSSPELDFQNSYAKLAGDVDLRVGGTVAAPSVLGHISVTDGSATFAGTKYELQRGDIYFTNPVSIDPVIDLDATAHVEDYDVTIGLHGTPSKLSFTYRSEPPLPQGDIFALLALGRTQEEQQIYSNQEQQAGVNSTADALLGGALNATVSSRIQKLFGGGSVKIDPTFVGTLGNSTARITVEQQIARNATLTYATNVNSTAEQLIQGQIDLTRTVSLVALRDESGVFSIVIKVRKRLH